MMVSRFHHGSWGPSGTVVSEDKSWKYEEIALYERTLRSEGIR